MDFECGGLRLWGYMETIKIESAGFADANEISALIFSSAVALKSIDFNAQGWAIFEGSNTPAALQVVIADGAYDVLVCWCQDAIAGVVVVKDREKLDKLFVHPDFQKRGIATLLWDEARSRALLNGGSGKFWVRSSSPAVPVYQAFGFECDGERQEFNGIRFQMMRLLS